MTVDVLVSKRMPYRDLLLAFISDGVRFGINNRGTLFESN